MKILCVCLSATIQRTIQFYSFEVNNVNRTKNWREDASGKALNAARVLNQLEPGCSTALCPVGNTNADHFLVLASRDNNLYVHPIYIEGNTRECWTILDTKNGTTTEVISDEDCDLQHIAGAEAELDLIENIREYMATYDALLFAGSRPTVWSANICLRICEVAQKAGKIILADFKGKDMHSVLQSCVPNIIKINEEEFISTFDETIKSEDDLEKAIAKKSEELKNIIVVTRGEKDTLAAEKGKSYRAKTENIKVVNATACGDAFSAGFLHEYLLTKDVGKSLAEGTRCASLNAQTVIPGSLS